MMPAPLMAVTSAHTWHSRLVPKAPSVPPTRRPRIRSLRSPATSRQPPPALGHLRPGISLGRHFYPCSERVRLVRSPQFCTDFFWARAEEIVQAAGTNYPPGTRRRRPHGQRPRPVLEELLGPHDHPDGGHGDEADLAQVEDEPGTI